MKNGVFNLTNKLLIPHSSDYYFLNSIPVTYNTTAKPEKIAQFFNEIYEENPELLFEIITYLITPNNKHEKAVVLVGSGRNGKSVYLKLCRAFLGKDNISAVSLQTLSGDRFATSSLFGKMANISADIPNKRVADSSIFKTLVSGKDLVDAQYKNQNAFTFECSAKLLFSCNELPKTSDNSDGYMRKWLILKFNRKFEGKEDNKNLIEELSEEDELSGLFNEAIARYNKLENNGFSYTEDTDAIRELYNDLSDPLEIFMDAYLSYDGMSGIPFKDLYEKYNEFLTSRKMARVTETSLGISCKKKNIKKHIVSVFKDDKRTTQNEIFGYCWKEGINQDVIQFNP